MGTSGRKWGSVIEYKLRPLFGPLHGPFKRLLRLPSFQDNTLELGEYRLRLYLRKHPDNVTCGVPWHGQLVIFQHSTARPSSAGVCTTLPSASMSCWPR